jgi:hypothetical protein
MAIQDRTDAHACGARVGVTRCACRDCFWEVMDGGYCAYCEDAGCPTKVGAPDAECDAIDCCNDEARRLAAGRRA